MGDVREVTPEHGRWFAIVLPDGKAVAMFESGDSAVRYVRDTWPRAHEENATRPAVVTCIKPGCVPLVQVKCRECDGAGYLFVREEDVRRG